jgi:hypothetical protein
LGNGLGQLASTAKRGASSARAVAENTAATSKVAHSLIILLPFSVILRGQSFGLACQGPIFLGQLHERVSELRPFREQCFPVALFGAFEQFFELEQVQMAAPEVVSKK